MSATSADGVESRSLRRGARTAIAGAVAGVLSAVLPAQQPAPSPPPATAAPLRGSRQLLLVITEDWGSTRGTLQRFQRSDEKGSWVSVGSFPVVVGRSGLGWGRGLPIEPRGGPVKQEGDGRAPAGVFRLGTAFGNAPAAPVGWRFPYRYLSDNVECVDDVRSQSYNRLTTREQVERPDWTSSEKMWQERLLVWGLVVEHNGDAPVPGAGSCIFLHVWNGPRSSTAGCTAMDQSRLTETIAWLDPERRPLIVQLPRAEYEPLKLHWMLP